MQEDALVRAMQEDALVRTMQEDALVRTMDGFVDPVWYQMRYPDIIAAKLDPVRHFIRFGLKEGRDPNRYFDCSWYARQYPDVQVSGVHPLLHYLAAGAAELRNPHPRFDAAYYTDQHPEAAANPLLFHLRVGAARGYATEKMILIQDYLPSTQPPLHFSGSIVVDIIIPVYRGLSETRRCLQSVLADKHRPPGKIIVVDDKSPEPKLAAYLDRLSAAGRITLLRNRRNVGFVHSVNTGIAAAADHDVVLLNSDTEVPTGWLRRLVAHAYAAPRIATVSPLSNNATICSYPSNDGGPIVFGTTLHDVDELCRAANAGRHVEAPTTVGFSMYIRREALSQVGMFDAKRFGIGYGEENDFCCRATELGWTHRIACDTFVYHKGSVSFGEKAQTLPVGAMQRLLERHPSFTEQVARHVSRDDIGPYRFALTAALIAQSNLPVILMVSHNFGGGVRHHVGLLLERLQGKAHVLLLEASARGTVLSVPVLPGHPSLALPADRIDDLLKILRYCRVGRVHIHHLLGMDMDVQSLIHRLGTPFDVTVHDNYAICPQMYLLPSPRSLYCNEPAPAGCNACIAALPSHGARDILSWRAEKAWQFQEADRVFCPSADTLSRLQRFGLGARAILAPHEPVADTTWPLNVVGPKDGPLRVAVLGVLADHKGARSVAAVAEAVDPTSIEFVVIGRTESNFPQPSLARLTVTGAFKEAELPGLIDSVAPHVIWFPGSAPESFSYTLSAAIASGVAIAATSIGSFPERLANRPFTWLAGQRTSPDGWIALFNEIRAALPGKPVTGTPARRPQVEDFYASHYLLPNEPAGPAYPMRLRSRLRRPVVVVVPERFSTGAATPCAFIRLLQPLDHPAINDAFDVVVTNTEGVQKYEADIIVTQRYALPTVQAAEALIRHAKKTKATLLYDLDDDLLNIGHDHPEAMQLRPKAKTVRCMVDQADALWVSTAALKDQLAPIRSDSLVVPNGLDERLWIAAPPYEQPAFGPVRILCMGTTTHERDFAMIAPALQRLKEELGADIEIDIIGMTGSADLPAGVSRLELPQHSVQSYPGFVHWLVSQQPGWHIGLAPLLDTPFNRSKSAIKTMDYAALGMAVLASDVPAYRGSVADGSGLQLVDNDPKAWHRALHWLVRDHQLRRSAAIGARQAFLVTGTLASQATARRDAWLRLLNRRRVRKAA